MPEGGYVGSFTIWTDSSDAETGYSGYSDWFFQTMFVCATASIVSGAVAERIKTVSYTHLTLQQAIQVILTGSFKLCLFVQQLQ